MKGAVCCGGVPVEYGKDRAGLWARARCKASKWGPTAAYEWIEYMGHGKVQGDLIFGRRTISRLTCAEK